MTPQIRLRPLKDSDRAEHADLLYSSFNSWYWRHGWGRNYFGAPPQEMGLLYDVYNDLTPGRSVAAFDKQTGRMMGACFFHPRENHVSLGVMSVHPNYGGQGVGRLLVKHILDFTKKGGYSACRLVGSALNMDSFSLYNRAGFVPRVTYQTMVLSAPPPGKAPKAPKAPKVSRAKEGVREATQRDVAAMGELEIELSGIRREIDYRYAISNPRGVFHATVYENDQRGIDGFMISVKSPALNMLGPCVARTEEVAVALVLRGLERFQGTWGALLVVPTDKRRMVEQMYAVKAINVETHLLQVWGDFPGFKGVSMPSFLPETG
ncbi:MAG TPA: GNAT family N-acetyltransferase [Myxococcaceae bacterium]|jgi:GNAT superfamily N-acetyltransferase